MPYPRAHYWVLVLLLPLVFAFWPTYFSPQATVQPALHIHGITAMLWLALIAGQSWLIHNDRRDSHKQLGRASFVLFPAFLTGLFLVIHTNAVGMAMDPDEVRLGVGPNFSAVSAVVILTVGYFFYSALKMRHNVQFHSRFLLATPILLIEPMTSRLINSYVPGFELSADASVAISNSAKAYYLSMAFVLAFVCLLFWRDRRYGRPFLLLAILIFVQIASYNLLGDQSWWTDFFVSTFNRPTEVVIAAGLVSGGLITWLGWNASPRTRSEPQISS